ncbi:E3 ubiquitin-protein ligase MGRN1-like isoform X1 [Stegostoma tigrinum]|uniref:E3 ubiquitin-protein ligase MGRN1-like isoform X1 n=1 Tax=Stegostoma tigrinum TaxID=3053191 RepID=UPI00202B6A1A|nr:E3 ubiquitin-protein ligase MGRN1-like isoform X1 [Stegostoma tigrinum]XP_048408001.1 E3 ubiquitin-protein ligase MGRN1-like isoform X1 [Stegostoma tigrinum]
MGSVLSRRIAGVEDIDIQANSAYRYPPKSGNYFASHFFMGGEKFDTPHPEGYLFGENMDLNFLGNRPVQFPYVTPAAHEPVKTLRSLVNIRKDSLRLVRYKDEADSLTDENAKPKVLYSVEFTFDADARVAITIYCQATEEFQSGMAVYTSKYPYMRSETIHYKRGVSQQFSLPSFKIDFSEWKEDELNFDLDKGVFPLVIRAVVDEVDEYSGHAHILLAAMEKHVDGSFSVKPLKQKQIVDRVSYLLQEIYGIENKNNQETKPSDDENSDNSNECVVCLSDLRDTLILPCRHLCLCSTCADTLRYQANNCPICRLPFRALLQIRAVRKKPGALSPVSFSPVLAQTMDHDDHSTSEHIPPGFEPVSLLEALNGLRSISPSIPSAPLYEEINYSGIGDGLCTSGRQLSAVDKIIDNCPQKPKLSKSSESSLRSPSSPIQEEDEEKLSEDSDVLLQKNGPQHPNVSSSQEVSVFQSTAIAETPEIEARDQVDRTFSEEIVQDSNNEHNRHTEEDGGTRLEMTLPGTSDSTESLKSQSTNSSSQPLLAVSSTVHIEDDNQIA